MRLWIFIFTLVLGTIGFVTVIIPWYLELLHKIMEWLPGWSASLLISAVIATLLTLAAKDK